MQKHILKLAILGALLVPLFSAAPAQAQATRTWVSGVGDDANPCSRTAPCKTFAGAISKTAAGGEIDCLDPGGFGAVTITKSITLDCSGTFGSILVAGTNAINVPTAGIVVLIRGLSLDGAGSGINGVSVTAGAQVTLEQCIVFGFTANGVNVSLSAGVANVLVINSSITQVNKGIALAASGTGAALLVVRNSNIYKTTASAVELGSANTFAMISGSMLTGNTTGVLITGGAGQATIMTSVVTFNTTGLNANASGAIMRMSDNNIIGNNTATAFVAGATLQSGGNNKIDPAGPAPNGTITNQ